MSREYKLTLSAHPNIYNNNNLRDYNVYFSEPDHGVNENTGLLLLISGFGGNANSNVYKKMRSKFADQYNLVTIQCDYFGQEFMQLGDSIQMNFPKESLVGIFASSDIEQIYQGDLFNPNKFLEMGSKYNVQVPAKEVLQENIKNFNDMGIMQAIDNITAVSYVINILKDNYLQFNSHKVILYGHSHGAYLSYLCNALAPNLFTLLIDNSSWLFPAYLQGTRHLYNQIGNMVLDIEFDYLASRIQYDAEILNLKSLYSNFDNHCEIICYHGTTDNLISHIDKRNFCSQINNCAYHEISQDQVDNKIFKSTNHGLDADFLEFFDYVMKDKEFEVGSELIFNPVKIDTRSALYTIDYEQGVPLLSRQLKSK